MFYKIIWTIANVVLRPIYWFRVKGKKNVPDGGAVVVGNHTANIDSPLVLLGIGRRHKMAFMGKAELFRFKPLGFVLKKLGAFPVERGKVDVTSIKHSFAALKDGKKLIIFPEGTRVKNGAGDAKSGAALFALRTKSPILPIYITPGHKAFKKSEVTIGEPYFLDGDPKSEENLKVQTLRIMNSVMALNGEKYAGTVS